MIDDQISTMDLIEQIERALPMSARLTPEAVSLLKNQLSTAALSIGCTVGGIHYMGDEGGIVCRLDAEAGSDRQAYISITHLRFDPRSPLSRKIVAYQRHRVKRLRRARG